MKNYKVSATVKANNKEDSKQIARKELGYEMNNVFFPLHWSEINTSTLIK